MQESTRAWQAVLRVPERGRVVAGCSAGAMVDACFIPALRRARCLGPPPHGGPAFDLVPDAVIISHFDELQPIVLRAWMAVRPSGSRGIGLDRETALVGMRGEWPVTDSGSENVMDTGGETILRAGNHIA